MITKGNDTKVQNEVIAQTITDETAKRLKLARLFPKQEIKENSDYYTYFRQNINLDEAINKGLYNVIGEEIDTKYISALKKLVLNPNEIKSHGNDLKIVYSPLHGTGNIPVQTILKELGFENVYVVPEQELPDGNFPTVSYPNPEDPKAFELALKLAKEKEADIVLATDEDTTNEIISDLFDSLLAMGHDGEVLIQQIIDDFVDKMIASDTIDEELVRVAIRFIKTDDEHGPVLVKDLVDNLMHVDNIIDFAEDLGFVDASDGRLKASLDFIKQITNNQTFDVNTDNLFVIEELLTYIKTDLAFDSVCQTYFEPKVPEQIYVRVKPLLDKIEPIYTRTIDAYIAQIEVAVAAAEDNGTTTAVDSGVTIQLNPVSELLIPVYDTLIDYYDKANQKVENSTNKIGQLYSKFYVENEYIDDIISLTRPEKWLNGSANDYTDEFSGYSITEFEDWYENIKALVVLADDLFVWYCENVDYEDVENAITSQEDRIINYSNLMCDMLTDFAENGIPESITDIYNNLMDNAMFENDLTNADGKVPVELQAYIERFAANATIGTVYLKVLERFGIRAEDLIGTLASSKINKTYTSEDIEKSLEKIEFGMQDGNKNYTTDYVFDNVIGDDYADVDAKGNSIEIQRAVKDSPLGDVVEPIE